MMKRAAVATLAALLLATPALAAPAIYTWTGYGLNVPEKGYWAWDPGGYIGLYKPDTFWVSP